LLLSPVERQRVRSCFRRHHLLAAHRADVDDIYDARLADRDVKAPRLLIEEDHVRCAAQGDIAEHPTRRRVDREQYAGIAGAQQPISGRIKVQAVRSFRRDRVFLRYPGRVAGIDSDDPRRRRDVDEEHLASRIVDCPTRAAGNLDFGDSFPSSDVDDRYRVRIRNRRVSDVRSDQRTASGVECEPVRLHTDGDLEGVPLGTRREHRDGIFASVAREDEAARFGDQRTGDGREARHRFDVPISRAVDDVDGIVAGMRDIEPVRG
jgi:hypothetical protein